MSAREKSLEERFHTFLDILSRKLKDTPAVERISREDREVEERAFKVLLSTILSARTKDEITLEISKRLFKRIKTPQDLVDIDEKELERLIYPVGFYRTKARYLKKLGEMLIEEFQGKVPRRLEDLIRLPGVGRKTGNLVITLAYDDYGICVDTHVHRICNRWEYIDTETPEESEMELRKKLPKRYWKIINTLLVDYGKRVCSPVPRCHLCPEEIREICPYYHKLQGIEKVLEKYNFKKVSKNNIPEEKGTYILKIKLKEPRIITYGKNRKRFKRGYYFYVGSAMGKSNNLRRRIERHLREDKKLHWHIDYLLQYGTVKEVYVSREAVECEVARDLSFLKSIEGFGSSDCSCKSHLFFMKS
ncbi:MAG TPA: DUF123 domain-containing protein [Methanothermococcus okinawensis]|uniref:thymine-DNA glycosylase n=1 Tax=Methanothermococcus okinawensis TaxID=155863 RepID=A0A832ZXC3_9EURY|nr:DUF123 domain-containing protein [Methanothermococcus okinawensis]